MRRPVKGRNPPCRIALAYSHRTRSRQCPLFSLGHCPGSSGRLAFPLRRWQVNSPTGNGCNRADPGRLGCPRCQRLHHRHRWLAGCRRIQQYRKIPRHTACSVAGLQHHINEWFVDGGIAAQYQHLLSIGHLTHTGMNAFDDWRVFQPFLGIYRRWCHPRLEARRLGVRQLHFRPQRLPQRRLHAQAPKSQRICVACNIGGQHRRHGNPGNPKAHKWRFSFRC